MGMEELLNKENIEAIKPIAGFIANIAIGLLKLKKDTTSILMRLAEEEGRLDFSPAHVRLIRLVNYKLSKGDSTLDLDGFSFYEILLAVSDVLKEINDENYKTFKSNIISSIVESLITVKSIDSNDAYKLKYAQTIAKLAFDKIDTNCKDNTLNHIEEYDKKINYNCYDNELKSNEYKEFVKDFIRIVEREANVLYDVKQLKISHKDFTDKVNITMSGHADSVCADDLVKNIISSIIIHDDECERVRTELFGDVYVPCKIKTIKEVNINITYVKYISSGVISSFINLYKVFTEFNENIIVNVKHSAEQTTQIKFINDGINENLNFIEE